MYAYFLIQRITNETPARNSTTIIIYLAGAIIRKKTRIAVIKKASAVTK